MRKNQPVKAVQTKSTVIVIIAGFLIAYLLFGWVFFLYSSIALSILGLFDRSSRLVHRLWMGLAKILSYIIPNILLTLIFYLILFPLALISRIGKSDPLMLKSEYKSYWVEDEGVPTKESFEKTW
ncbi:MAG: hypothetical protein JJU37_14275 [Balneolaceae bacterium]|nr:hypothetical protein [Balneolaceae bacterium]